jgi:putative SOS response-associated peptidase YedK
MLFAGLYESWYPAPNQPEVTFTIVTCAANAMIAPIHDRMPVILDEGSDRIGNQVGWLPTGSTGSGIV